MGREQGPARRPSPILDRRTSPGTSPKNEEAPHGGGRGILRFLWGELMMGREDPSSCVIWSSLADFSTPSKRTKFASADRDLGCGQCASTRRDTDASEMSSCGWARL